MASHDPRSATEPVAAHTPSYYAATASCTIVTQQLAGSFAYDVCVIGGGYTGLSAALHLARRGIKVVVLEQALVGWGASGRNGGQIHVGMRRNQQWISAQLGRQAARDFWALSLRARSHLDWLLHTYSIVCDLRTGLLHADHRSRYLLDSARYVEFLNQEYGYADVRVVSGEEMRNLVATTDYVGGTFDKRGGHLHALNLALGIARGAQKHGAQIHERSEVTGLARQGDGWVVNTASGSVTSKVVLLACNGYIRDLVPEVGAHVMPINNFIAVTEPLDTRHHALIRNGYAVSDSRFVVYYFRMTPDNRLLFGGGENYTYRFPRDISGYVKRHILRLFPQLAAVQIAYAWGGTLAITPNRMPFVRELQPGLFNASGFSGKGVVLAPYVGRIVANAITGERDEFDLISGLRVPRFPGGSALRAPTLIAGMSWAALRDRL